MDTNLLISIVEIWWKGMGRVEGDSGQRQTICGKEGKLG